jgi:hypothetical protein
MLADLRAACLRSASRQKPAVSVLDSRQDSTLQVAQSMIATNLRVGRQCMRDRNLGISGSRETRVALGSIGVRSRLPAGGEWIRTFSSARDRSTGRVGLLRALPGPYSAPAGRRPWPSQRGRSKPTANILSGSGQDCGHRLYCPRPGSRTEHRRVVDLGQNCSGPCPGCVDCHARQLCRTAENRRSAALEDVNILASKRSFASGRPATYEKPASRITAVGDPIGMKCAFR